MIEAIKAGDLDTVRAGIRARSAAGSRQGQDLGYTYEAGALVPDGTALPEVTDRMRDYVLCAPNYCLRYRPAARQPQMVETSLCHLGFRCIVRGSDRRLHQDSEAVVSPRSRAMEGYKDV
jgi:hypothetical protein